MKIIQLQSHNSFLYALDSAGGLWRLCRDRTDSPVWERVKGPVL